MTTEVAEESAGQTRPCAHCGKTSTVALVGGVVRKPKSHHLLSVFVVFMLVVGCDTIGIGIALLLPAVQAAREAARRMACRNNLGTIGLAMQNYHQKYGSFPPSFIPDKHGKPKHSWRVLLLPFLNEEALYRKYRFDEPWNGPHNSALASQMPSVYLCPSESPPGVSQTSYAMIVGPHAFPTVPRLAKWATSRMACRTPSWWPSAPAQESTGWSRAT